VYFDSLTRSSLFDFQPHFVVPLTTGLELRIMPHSGSCHRRSATSRKLRMEVLPPRTLLAGVTGALSDGVATISGSPQSDEIIIAPMVGQDQVHVFDKQECVSAWPRSEVREIDVLSAAGDDLIRVAEPATIPVKATGGLGTDVVLIEAPDSERPGWLFDVEGAITENQFAGLVAPHAAHYGYSFPSLSEIQTEHVHPGLAPAESSAGGRGQEADPPAGQPSQPSGESGLYTNPATDDIEGQPNPTTSVPAPAPGVIDNSGQTSAASDPSSSQPNTAAPAQASVGTSSPRTTFLSALLGAHAGHIASSAAGDHSGHEQGGSRAAAIDSVHSQHGQHGGEGGHAQHAGNSGHGQHGGESGHSEHGGSGSSGCSHGASGHNMSDEDEPTPEPSCHGDGEPAAENERSDPRRRHKKDAGDHPSETDEADETHPDARSQKAAPDGHGEQSDAATPTSAEQAANEGRVIEESIIAGENESPFGVSEVEAHEVTGNASTRKTSGRGISPALQFSPALRATAVSVFFGVLSSRPSRSASGASSAANGMVSRPQRSRLGKPEVLHR
jgi:hypothetical protein